MLIFKLSYLKIKTLLKTGKQNFHFEIYLKKVKKKLKFDNCSYFFLSFIIAFFLIKKTISTKNSITNSF